MILIFPLETVHMGASDSVAIFQILKLSLYVYEQIEGTQSFKTV